MLARLGIADAMKQKLRPYPTGGAVEAVALPPVELWRIDNKSRIALLEIRGIGQGRRTGG
jgi:hypothetical protein